MKLLLDTSEFLWYVSADIRLSDSTKKAIEDPANQVFLSVVSLWEIVIKNALGKLPLPQSPEVYVPAQRQLHRIESLNLEEGSVQRLASLPMVHRDPFDRMIICQAQFHSLHLASSDPLIQKYPVKFLQ